MDFEIEKFSVKTRPITAKTINDTKGVFVFTIRTNVGTEHKSFSKAIDIDVIYEDLITNESDLSGPEYRRNILEVQFDGSNILPHGRTMNSFVSRTLLSILKNAYVLGEDDKWTLAISDYIYHHGAGKKVLSVIAKFMVEQGIVSSTEGYVFFDSNYETV